MLMAHTEVLYSEVEPVWTRGRNVHGSVCLTSMGMPSQVSQGRGRKIRLLTGVASRTLQVVLLGSTWHTCLLMLTGMGSLTMASG